MSDSWNSETVATQLLKLLPVLGRQIGRYMRETSQDEATFMQVMALGQLHEQSLTASELAKQRKVSLQSASVLVQALVERGWVVRNPDPNDRRQSRLELTPEGLAQHSTTISQMVEHLRGALGELTPEQIEAARTLLPALHNILSAQNVSECAREK